MVWVRGCCAATAAVAITHAISAGMRLFIGFINPSQLSPQHSRARGQPSFLRTILTYAIGSKHYVVDVARNETLEFLESLGGLGIAGRRALDRSFLLLLCSFNTCQVLILMNDEHHEV